MRNIDEIVGLEIMKFCFVLLIGQYLYNYIH
jgi:hypothetical protein